MKTDLLRVEKTYLAHLLEAIQRCVYFLDAATQKIVWPLQGESLQAHKKDIALFDALSVLNERFAKLQDTLATALRHALLLLGEQHDSFLKVLAYYQKHEVIDSIEDWQLLRTTHNLAAHDYEIDYADIAEHFNNLHDLLGTLYLTSQRFVDHCQSTLGIVPHSADFSEEFFKAVAQGATSHQLGDHDE